MEAIVSGKPSSKAFQERRGIERKPKAPFSVGDIPEARAETSMSNPLEEFRARFSVTAT